MIARAPNEDYYGYQPLEKLTSIRLLKIVQLTNDCPIKCEVIHLDLDGRDIPKYAALSYLWGDPNDRTPIMCNGKHLLITSTLEVALRMTHAHNSTEYVWADQVCINQDDLAEKPKQIQLMTSIYHCAWDVLAWLGPERVSTENAMKQIEKVASTWRSENDPDFEDYGYFETDRLDEPEVGLSSSKLRDTFQADKVMWLALNRFYDCSYFERAWVVQEMVTSIPHGMTRQIGAHAICGPHRVSWGNVVAAARWMFASRSSRYQPPSHSDRTVDGIEHVQDLALGSAEWCGYATSTDGVNRFVGRYTWDTVEVFRRFRYRKATDPRDKVFAMLGLVEYCKDFDGDQFLGIINGTLTNSSKMPIDYSLSVMETYRNFARSFIEWKVERIAAKSYLKDDTQHALDLLNDAGMSPDTLGWPSWVPDWRNSVIHKLPKSYASGCDNEDNKVISAEIYPHQDPQCLRVGGILLGHVDWVCDQEHASQIIRVGDARDLSKCVEDRLRPNYKYGSGIGGSNPTESEPKTAQEPTAAAFLWTLSLGGLPALFREAGISPEDYERDQSLYQFMDWLRAHDNGEQINLTSSEEIGLYEALKPVCTDDAMHYFFGIMRRALCKRRLFTTGAGHLGLGSLQMREGDVAAILFGMSTPCILRPFEMETGEHAYRLLSDAWIRGVMHGEAIEHLLSERGSKNPLAQVFTLR